MSRRIAVIVTGYVGLTTGAYLASLGHRVVCTDVDEAKIEPLRDGRLDIPGRSIAQLGDLDVWEARLGVERTMALAYPAAAGQAHVACMVHYAQAGFVGKTPSVVSSGQR